LSKIGVTEDVYNSEDFRKFAKQFNATVPVEDVYNIYRKQTPQKEYKTMGSMKNSYSGDSAVKDFYTPEEARKFSARDLEKNPEIETAIINSMPKWRK
jgi:hypothetical protein